MNKPKKKLTQEQIQNQAIAVKKLSEMTKEVVDYAKSPDIGIDSTELHAFIKNHKWVVNPRGHTKTIRNEIRKLMSSFLKINQNLKSQADVYESQADVDDIMKQILEKGLVDFHYDVEAEDPELGPTPLKLLAQELAHFLVVIGGKVGSKHSEMLQKQEQLSQLDV